MSELNAKNNVESIDGNKKRYVEEVDVKVKELADQVKAGDNSLNKLKVQNLDFILDIPLKVTVELGRTSIIIKDLLQLGQGSVLELDKLAGEPLEILVNGKLVAKGEVVVVNEKFGIRLTDIISPLERIETLK
jgi:flagellar motor switch protein FliN